MSESEVPSLDKYHEIELQHVFDAMTHTQNLRIQVGVFFGTVDLGAIGIAFSQRSSGLIFLGIGLIIGLLLVDSVARRHLLYLSYRATQLRERYAYRDSQSFFPQSGWVKYSAADLERILATSDMDRPLAIQRLNHLFLRSMLVGVSFLLPLGAVVAQFILALIMWQVFEWQLF